MIRWIEANCRFGEGDKFGQPVRLELFQKIFLCWLFELRADGKRRYRRAFLETPKGNAKTPMAAWVAAYLLATQNSAVIPVAAASYEQADLLFGDLRACVKESPTLAPLFDAFEGEVQVKDGPGRAFKVAAIAGTNDGQRPSAFMADEIHEWGGNKARVHLVIANGCAKRADSLVFNTSTPGADKDSFAGRLHAYGCKVNAGEIVDDEFLFVHWGADPEAFDLDDPAQLDAAIRAANPAAGAFVSVPNLTARFRQVPRHEFVRYHLGWWTTVAESWLPAGAAADCVSADGAPESGAPVVLGFDGSFNNDSTALVGVSVDEPHHVFVVAAWERPEFAAHDWQVPILDVEAAIRGACKRWQVVEIACDPFRWARSYQVLEGEGLPVVEFPQAQPLDEPVLTPEGWAAMGSLQVGDRVIGGDGRPTTVSEVHPQGICEIFEVRFSDGSSTRCTAAHLWLVTSPTAKYQGKNPQPRTLAWISRRPLKVGRAFKRFIPMAGPVEHRERALPVHPYLLGALLGDGNFTGRATPRITSIDGEIVQRLRECLPEGVSVVRQGASDCHYALSAGAGARANPLTVSLRELGVYGLRGEVKHVPELYLVASVEQRLELLRGLMDTDGTVSVTGTVSFHSTSPHLRDGVVRLVQSLGGTARCNERPIRGKMRRPAWIVAVKMPRGLNPFYLPRKAVLVSETKQPTRSIVSIAPAGRVPVRCITVANSDGLYVTKDYLVTHNSPSRMTPATQRFYDSIIARMITLDGDPRLMRHLDNATLRSDARGTRIAKEHARSTRKIDLAVAAIMALERAAWHAGHPATLAAVPGIYAF